MAKALAQDSAPSRKRPHLGPSGRREVTQILLSSLFRAMWGQGIHTLLGVYDLQVGRVLSRVGCRPKAIGPICTMDRGLRTVAGQFTVDEDAIMRLESCLETGTPRVRIHNQ